MKSSTPPSPHSTTTTATHSVELAGADADAAAIREAIAHGRLDGTLEGMALVLTDACLADCIEQLGDHAENPTSDQLREVLPGLAERHGVAITRIMLASTVVGEAPASVDHPRPPQARRPGQAPARRATSAEPDGARCRRSTIAEQRAAIKAKRKEMKERKQAAARASREQAARARHRA